MKKYLSILLLFCICISFFPVLLMAEITLDDIIQEAQDLWNRGWNSGRIKNHLEIKYMGYLTRDEINDIVNYALGDSQVKPIELESKIARIPDEVTATSYHTGGYNYYSPTGLPGLLLSAIEGVSARSKALGGAFTAVYDDPNSVFRNSSGVIQDNRHSMSFVIDGSSLGPSVSHISKVAGVYSHKLASLSLGGGFIYISETMHDIEASYKYFSLHFNAGKEFLQALQTGIKLKLNSYTYNHIYLDDEKSDIGLGLDLGLNYNYLDFLSAGFSFQSYNKFEFENDYTEKIPSQIFLGTSIRPIGNLIALFDLSYIFWSAIDNEFIDFANTANLHIGVEYSIMMTKPKIGLNVPYKDMKQSGNALAFRAGFRTETTPIETKESRNHYALGVGYTFKIPAQVNLGFDFASDYFSYALDGNYSF